MSADRLRKESPAWRFNATGQEAYFSKPTTETFTAASLPFSKCTFKRHTSPPAEFWEHTNTLETLKVLVLVSV